MKESNIIDAEFEEDNKNTALAVINNPSIDTLSSGFNKDVTRGVSMQAFDEKVIAILSAPVDQDLIEIRPDGIIYLPGVHYRQRLNQAFGVGGWGVVRLEVFNDDNNNIFYRGALYAFGRYVADAIGEAKYFANNANSSKATALESAKTDCITRLCKDLGVASELWSPRFVAEWKANYAIQVWVDILQKDGKPPSKTRKWRRIDAPPIDQYPFKEQSTIEETNPANDIKARLEAIKYLVLSKNLPLLIEQEKIDKVLLASLAKLDEYSNTKFGKSLGFLHPKQLDFILNSIRLANVGKEGK